MEEEKNGLNPEPGMAESVSDGTVSDSSTEEESVKAEERHPEPEQPPVTEDKQPEAPRMESVEPVRPAAESSQGPWQGGYGDTRDTAFPAKKIRKRHVHCRSGDGNPFAGLLLLWLCEHCFWSAGDYFRPAVQRGGTYEYPSKGGIGSFMYWYCPGSDFHYRAADWKRR